MKNLSIAFLSAAIAASLASCGGGSGGGGSGGNGGDNVALIAVNPAIFSLNADDASQTITVSNTGTATASNLTLPTLNVPLSQVSTTCGSNLAAESSCTYTLLVDYTQSQPVVAGNQQLKFNYNNGQQAQTTNAAASWSASGGGDGSTLLTVTPATFSLNVDDSSQTITIANHTSAPVNNLTLPTLNSPMSLAATTCGSSLAANSSCIYTVLVDYTQSQPIIAGNQQLIFGYNDGQVQTANVTANWTANMASLTATPAFVQLTENEPSQVITVSNTSTVTATNLSLPTLNNPLSQVSTNCGTSLASNSSCTYAVSINYTGQTIPVGDQQLVLSYNDGQQTQTENVAASWSASGSTPTPVPPFGNYDQIYTNMAPIVPGSDNGFCATINGTNQVSITPLNDGTGNSQLCDSTGFCTVLQQAGTTCGQVAWTSTGVGAGAHVINYLNCNLSNNKTVLTAEARLENSGNPIFTCTGNVELSPQ